MVSFVLDQVEAKGVCQIICSLGGVGRARVTCTGYVHRKSITYLGGSFGAVTTRVNTRLGPPLLITRPNRPNPARGRAATAPEYFRGVQLSVVTEKLTVVTDGVGES